MSPPPTAEQAELRSRLSLYAGTSNAILPLEEERILRSMLADEQQCISELNREIDQLDIIIAGLHMRRQRHASKMDRFSIALSSYKRLPTEVLAKVFQNSVTNDRLVLPPNNTHAPWVFLQVCSRWREVARAERGLWNHLEVRGESSLVKRMLTRFLPPLWDPTQTFPVSITLGISWSDVYLHDIFLPYSHRLGSITLRAGMDTISVFLFGSSVTFEILEALDIKITRGLTPGRAPPADFANFPKLRRISIVDLSSEKKFAAGSLLPTIPWPQITHVSLWLHELSWTEFKHIVTHCNNLLSVEFIATQSTAMDPVPDMVIQLPALRSMTLITSGYLFGIDFLHFLSVPSLKELTVDQRYFSRPFPPECWTQGHLGRMLNRSECSLETLVLQGGPQDVSFKKLVPSLSSLVKFVVSASTPIPGEIFDMMTRGEVLKKLEHLECFTPSPVPFLRLLEHQYNHRTPSAYRGLLFAKVSYRAPKTSKEIDEYLEMHNSLDSS